MQHEWMHPKRSTTQLLWFRRNFTENQSRTVGWRCDIKNFMFGFFDTGLELDSNQHVAPLALSFLVERLLFVRTQICEISVKKTLGNHLLKTKQSRAPRWNFYFIFVLVRTWVLTRFRVVLEQHGNSALFFWWCISGNLDPELLTNDNWNVRSKIRCSEKNWSGI